MPDKPKRGYFLSERLYKTLVKMAKDYRNGRLTNKPSKPDGPVIRGGSSAQIGKPAPTGGFAPGALTDPDNIVNEWDGPWVTGAAATGAEIECDWSTGTFASTEYVVVTTFSDGAKVVSCFPVEDA